MLTTWGFLPWTVLALMLSTLDRKERKKINLPALILLNPLNSLHN
jgi:hypothetical protein